MKWKMFDFPFIGLTDSAVALLVKFPFPLEITGNSKVLETVLPVQSNVIVILY